MRVGPGSAERHFAPHRVRDTAWSWIRPVYPLFPGEGFSLRRPPAGNKTTAICGRNNRDIAILAAVSTPPGAGATFQQAPMIWNEGSAGRRRNEDHAASRHFVLERTVADWPAAFPVPRD